MVGLELTLAGTRESSETDGGSFGRDVKDIIDGITEVREGVLIESIPGGIGSVWLCYIGQDKNV